MCGKDERGVEKVKALKAGSEPSFSQWERKEGVHFSIIRKKTIGKLKMWEKDPHNNEEKRDSPKAGGRRLV